LKKQQVKIAKQYKSWLADIMQNISNVRLQTSLQVNANMLLVYWYIGKQIQQKVELEGCSAKVVEQLAKDLQKAFHDSKGFSVRNLKYMQRFAREYSADKFVQTPSSQLEKKAAQTLTQTISAQPGKSISSIVRKLSAQLQSSPLFKVSWSHHTLLLDKISNSQERLWYLEQSVVNGWSVRVLDYQVATKLYQRQAKTRKTNNFHLTLPKEQSDLANEILKRWDMLIIPQVIHCNRLIISENSMA
jgi:Protein of unknown function (DUF1016).